MLSDYCIKDEYGRPIERPHIPYIYTTNKDTYTYPPFNTVEIWKHGGFLNESFGVKEYNNTRLRANIIDFVNNKLLKNIGSDYTYNTSVMFDGVWRRKYRLLRCKLEVDWCDHLNVLLTRGSEDIDCILLAKNTIDGVCQTYDIKHNTVFHSFATETDRLKYFSVILSIPNDYICSAEDLCGIIFHEIQHAFRLFRSNFENDKVNRDLIYFQSKCDDDTDFMSDIYAIMKDGVKVANFCNVATSEQLFIIIRDFSYYLNLSEIEARRATFMSDCKKNGLANITCVSPSYYMYYRMFKTLDLFRRRVRNSEKEKFAHDYLGEIEPIYFGHYQKLMHNGTYDAVSFDRLMAFFEERIKTYFLDRCDKIFADIKSR